MIPQKTPRNKIAVSKLPEVTTLSILGVGDTGQRYWIGLKP
jgi:hypothetical protein